MLPHIHGSMSTQTSTFNAPLLYIEKFTKQIKWVQINNNQLKQICLPQQTDT